MKEPCRDAKGNPEPDSDLRDTESIPLPEGTELAAMCPVSTR